MMSGNIRCLAAACLALLAVGTAVPLTVASPLIAVNADAPPLPEPIRRLVAPGGRLVEVRTGEGMNSGPGDLIDRTLRFVDEFDPHDDLPTQVQNAQSFAFDAFHIARDSVNCVAFVADPAFLDRITVDLSGFPERLRIEVPFAMATASGYAMGYLLIVIRPSGELECGLGNDTGVLQ